MSNTVLSRGQSLIVKRFEGQVYRPFRVGSILVLGGITNKALLVVPSNVGWCDAVTLVVCDDLDLAALHDGDARVGCSQIDANDGASDTLVLRSLSLDSLCGEETECEDEEEI